MPNPTNMEPKSDLTWTNQEHRHVRNHARINNLASIYFDYQ